MRRWEALNTDKNGANKFSLQRLQIDGLMEKEALELTSHKIQQEENGEEWPNKLNSC